MTPKRWTEIEDLYHRAVKVEQSQRTAFLRDACEDGELRHEVESLLAKREQLGSFLDEPALQKLDLASGSGQSWIGRRVRTYEIQSLLGIGGMGEVYRARDTKLRRDVAIKVLPFSFAQDRDRLSRFEQEARTLAALNHPHIGAIYGFEEVSDRHALVLELVEGPTLADRLEARAIPVDEALRIARQIADALEAAHEKGIVHRDLKPANIKITPDGNVKLLDFGLAKAFAGDVASADLSQMRTGTEAGMILGTPSYMSPEQARGQTVDKRTDIWAFGCVLYEMLRGGRAFAGDTASEAIAAVIGREPDWGTLPKTTPASIRRLLQHCLEKDPKRRFHDIADVRILLEALLNPGTDVVHEAVGPTKGNWRLWIAASLCGALAVSVLYFYFSRPAPAEPPEIRLEVNTPPTADPASFAISPDGRRLVFSALNDGKPQLWVRPFDSIAALPLAGTEGASRPFWSPDSASLGFFADGKLKRIDILGGAPQVLANAINGWGGAWSSKGVIIFVPSAAGGSQGALLKVPATGGEPEVVTRLEAGQLDFRSPQFLPGDKNFIYFVRGGPNQGLYAGSLDGTPSKRLTNVDGGAVVAPSGFLLFPRQTTLFAQAFDFKKQELSGNPFPVADRVVGFSAASGVLAYRTGSAGGVTRQLTWLDRSGKIVGTVGAPDAAGLSDVELSPDGKRVAVWRSINNNGDIWIIDLARGAPVRFTFDVLSDLRPLWLPDGNRIVFQSIRTGVYNLYTKLSSGEGTDELLLKSEQTQTPNDASSDGRFLLFRSLDPRTGLDLWVLPLTGDKKPFPFLKTPFDERDGQFSPDGKWIAYQSNESGRYEIVVQPFPGPGGKFQISTNGGTQVRWNKNGKEIFYISPDSRMMAVAVKVSQDGQSLETGTPVALFPVRIAGGPLSGINKQQYAVSSDGQRFLVNLEANESAMSPITIIYNWKPR